MSSLAGRQIEEEEDDNDDDDDVDDDDVKVSEVKWVERQIGEESSFCPLVFCTQPSYFKWMWRME